MTGFRGKLRRFVSNWVSIAEGAPAASAPALSFIFNADDTPRLWSEDVAAFWPPGATWPQRDFPQFLKLATNDIDRLAA
ncbi:MAG: hypothetical protein JWR47_1214 [Phenylobacterium sp.]|jgi:hypothetical protein|uniref:hypothetical protein n=1 Tax=Phenylobacterium sp. TaxID=1871053 RepID=UPI002626D660|nr:hypothetical protein [Phenylobacterium sp.]MDB5427835.1 hypothetical protein [Phenylobacterium sp.]MDB5434957.1 hypothetical protein [Phenylobacterium sp.]MDB5498260.1 hypothetical protein [Phenylobacterium sp.]